MLDWMFAIIIVLAVMLFLIVFLYEKNMSPQWLMGFIILDIVIWWSLAFANFQIEQPYEIYNVSSAQIETGFHYIYSTSSPAVFYIFLAFGIIMFVYMSYFVFMTVLDKVKKMKGF